jgi:hypothetical protein
MANTRDINATTNGTKTHRMSRILLIQILRYSFNPSHYSEEGNWKSIRRGQRQLGNNSWEK